MAFDYEGGKAIPQEDNYLIRISVDHIETELIDYYDNSGFSLNPIVKICDDKWWQLLV